MKHIEIKFDGFSVTNTAELFNITLVGLSLTIYKN